MAFYRIKKTSLAMFLSHYLLLSLLLESVNCHIRLWTLQVDFSLLVFFFSKKKSKTICRNKFCIQQFTLTPSKPWEGVMGCTVPPLSDLRTFFATRNILKLKSPSAKPSAHVEILIYSFTESHSEFTNQKLLDDNNHFCICNVMNVA